MLLVVACVDDKNSTDATASHTDATDATDATVTMGTMETASASSTDGATDASTSQASSTGSTGSTGSTSSTSSTGSTGSTGSVDPEENVSVENACGPTDGPALEFRLGVTGPKCDVPWVDDELRVLVWQGAPLAPGDYVLTPETGFASLRVGLEEPVNSKSGTLTITSWEGDVIVGSYDLTFVDETTRQGDFSGEHCHFAAPCG